MKDRFYSVEEIAKIIDLHPKTVRRFIREGKIKAKKAGREWRIHEDDFKEYAHSELREPEGTRGGTGAAEGPAAAGGYAEAETGGSRGGSGGYAEPGDQNRITVSAVVEIHEKEPEEASRISNSLIALLNSKDPSWGSVRYDFIYHPEVRKARFVLYGTPEFIASIMKMFSVIAEQR